MLTYLLTTIDLPKTTATIIDYAIESKTRRNYSEKKQQLIASRKENRQYRHKRTWTYTNIDTNAHEHIQT